MVRAQRKGRIIASCLELGRAAAAGGEKRGRVFIPEFEPEGQRMKGRAHRNRTKKIETRRSRKGEVEDLLKY
jgi:hypothetical protein